MDKSLIDAVEKIRKLAAKNAEFDAAMRNLFGKTDSASTVYTPSGIVDDVTAIREALEIRANKSVNYDFVNDQRLRDQLIIDNLRMENAALNLQESEDERFYVFCVNAFYQLENIVNYFFFVTYPDFNNLQNVVEEYTKNEPSEDFRYKRRERERNVGDILIAHKINALCNMLFPDDPIKITLGTLRQVRNEGEHRCMVIRQEKDEKNYLYKFFKYNSFNSIRKDLIKVANAIRNNIGKSLFNPVFIKEANIVAVLPSACFVRISGNTYSLPNNLISKVNGRKTGDIIKLKIKSGKIVDIVC